MNLYLVAALGMAAIAPQTTPAFTAEIKSKLAFHLLVSEACDRMIGSSYRFEARASVASALEGFGYSRSQASSMFNGFLEQNINYYVLSVEQTAGNSEYAIRHFCDSAINDNRKSVEGIKALNSR